ncbi:uncharacterized protein E1O_12160 [Burkholderiales bacterium GJ-E10]|nr:uncharacterized protein E1O_12160 [Burkholderiales bacterium GJ-E10]
MTAFAEPLIDQAVIQLGRPAITWFEGPYHVAERWKVKVVIKVLSNFDLLLSALLVLTGMKLIRYPTAGSDPAATATLVGALFGGAAVLFGSWVTRWSAKRQSEEELVRRRQNLCSLIAAELVNLAAGLLTAKQFVDAAVSQLQAGQPLAGHFDMSWCVPRELPLTQSLGVDLQALDAPTLDALATLLSNLSLTRRQMNEITSGSASLGSLLTATALSRGIGHDMTVLAAVFEHVAPNRKLAMADKPSEFITKILRDAARDPTPFGPSGYAA